MARQEHHYLSLLVPALKKHADRLIMRPYNGGSPPSWGGITFRQWDIYLEAARTHWKRVLGNMSLHPGDIVGVWLTGRKWTDLLNISGASAAGYIPQLFSNVFSPDVIRCLLALSGAKALIFDTQDHPDAPSGCLLPSIPALESADLDQLIRAQPQHAGLMSSALPAVDTRAPAVIFHSSGTTSGVPKLIPSSHLLLKTFILRKFPDCLLHGQEERTSNVFNSLGSLAHVGSFQAFHGAAANGCCTVQSSSMAMESDEMATMIRICGLNRLVQYATFVSTHIRMARTNPEVRRALQSLRQILYTGVALSAEDREWALANGLRLTEMYGTSETAPLMISRMGATSSARMLRPCDGACPIFVPHMSAATENANERRPVLYEIVVAAEAPDAPPAALFGSDGVWHTGDLFEKVHPDDGGPPGWIHRGRAGDWIKTVCGFVDTKSIEDAVRKACADIVFDAVVVGSSRTHPVLIVESEGSNLTESMRRQIAAQIVDKTANSNQGMFPYERIKDPAWIIVLEKGSLPRTKEKGNIRRNATEEVFKAQIDAVFDAQSQLDGKCIGFFSIAKLPP